jgi:hypothetical protein
MSDLYRQIMNATARRMDAAAITLTNALKETLSVPVPRLVNKNVRMPFGGRMVKQRRTFIKDGKGLTLVNRGALKTLTDTKGRTETYMVPWRDYTIYHKVSGDPVLVKRATPGAPPRKFEGRLRAGHTWERRDFIDNQAAFAFSVTAPRASGSMMVRRVGTNVNYARPLEQGGHPYFAMTLMRVKPQLEKLMGQP